MTIGVLALQGSYNGHISALRRLGVKGVERKKPEQLDNISAVIIPGGESTTMAKLAEYHNLFPALREFVKMGKLVWGTCAGLIFLADKAIGKKEGGQELVGGLDCTVHRNFFGSQIQSFEVDLSVPELSAQEGGLPSFRGVFIRAPAIVEAGPGVETTSKSDADTQEVESLHEQKVIVAVKQGNLLGTAFHPELTADTRWHSYFLKILAKEDEPSPTTLAVVEGGVDLTAGQTPEIEMPIYQ
ncbi:hypothetical protein MKX03_006912 [Papaver bracteatum]|nr:hypothetical protein MKX03_006912 [Papaver bracteatum]